jgi:hypothetical protein
LQGGGLWYFVSFRIFFFGQHESLDIYFFCCEKRKFFSPKFNIRLYDKNSESDYFVFPPPKSEYFFQQHWDSEYFFRKKTYPPFKLNGRSLRKTVFWKSAIIGLLVSFLPFQNLFNPLLAAFRSGCGRQSTLLRILEDWKKALDSDTYLAAILMDLSKVLIAYHMIFYF